MKLKKHTKEKKPMSNGMNAVVYANYFSGALYRLFEPGLQT